MKKFVSIAALAAIFLLTLSTFASACGHTAVAGAYCATCAAQYNQAVGAFPDPNTYTKTTVTETVTQPATTGLQVSAQYAVPTQTTLAPAPVPVGAPAPYCATGNCPQAAGFVAGAYQPPVALAAPSYAVCPTSAVGYGAVGIPSYSSVGYSSVGIPAYSSVGFGAGYGGIGFGAGLGYGNGFGANVILAGHRAGFGGRGFSSGNFRVRQNFGSRGFVGIGGFNGGLGVGVVNPGFGAGVVVASPGVQFRSAGGRVQALPRIRNAIGALRGR